MDRIKLLTCLIAFLATNNLIGATHEEAGIGFAIDLPDGYVEKTRSKVGSDTIVLRFGNESEPVIIITTVPIEAAYRDNEEVFEMQLASTEELLEGQTSVRELYDFDIGGMPARWGWMDRSVNASGNKLLGIGAVELDDLRIGFTAILDSNQDDTWRSRIESSFASIREYGEAIGDIGDKVAVTRNTTEPVQIPPSTYEHPLFSLDLPGGWQGTTLETNPKKVTMAKLDGPPGAAILVFCMSGWVANQKTMEEVLYGPLSNAMPNITHLGQKKIKAANGKKALINRYEGRMERDGATVILDGVTASVKHRKCWLGLMGIAGAGTGEQRVDEMLEILLSVH